MHILVVAGHYPDASDPLEGIFERDQAHALAHAGHRVTYAAIDLRSARHKRASGITHFSDGTMEVYTFSFPVGPIPTMLRLIGENGFRRLLGRICREQGTPDIVHAHFLGAASLAAPAVSERGIPFVITEHTSALNTAQPTDAQRRTMLRTYPKAAALLTVSSGLQQNILLATGIRATVVPNIVDTEAFGSQKIKTGRGETFRFAAGGGLIARKGYDLVLNAMGTLTQKGYRMHLSVYGDGPERHALEEQASRLGIRESVDFCGRCSREEMAVGYADADAFVLASRRETFGVVYIEAMAAGLPVIATSCGGPEDFVTEKNGILIPVDDEKALTEAMEHMMLHRADYDSAAIAAETKKQFAPEAIAARLTEIYQTVIK